MIVLSRDGRFELWSDMAKICRHHKEIKYGTITKKKFPFEYKGWTFERKPVNSGK